MTKKNWVHLARLSLLALISILLVSCSIPSCGCKKPYQPQIIGAYIPEYSGTAEAAIIDAKGTTFSTVLLDEYGYYFYIGLSTAPYLIEVKLDNGRVFYTTVLERPVSHTFIDDNVSNLSTLSLVLASYPYIPEFKNLKSIHHNWPLLATKLNADLIDHASKVIYANLQTYYTEEGLLPDNYNDFSNIEWGEEIDGIVQLISRTQIIYDFTQTIPAGITIKIDGNVIPFDPYINVDAIDFTYQCTMERQNNSECILNT